MKVEGVIVFIVCEGFSPLHYSLFLLYQQRYGWEGMINRRGIGIGVEAGSEE
jgi:hypothetical protein